MPSPTKVSWASRTGSLPAGRLPGAIAACIAIWARGSRFWGKGCLMSLAVWRLGVDDHQMAVGLQLHNGLLTSEHASTDPHLGRSWCGLDKGGEADPQVTALGASSGLLLAEGFVVHQLE